MKVSSSTAVASGCDLPLLIQPRVIVFQTSGTYAPKVESILVQTISLPMPATWHILAKVFTLRVGITMTARRPHARLLRPCGFTLLSAVQYISRLILSTLKHYHAFVASSFDLHANAIRAYTNILDMNASFGIVVGKRCLRKRAVALYFRDRPAVGIVALGALFAGDVGTRTVVTVASVVSFPRVYFAVETSPIVGGDITDFCG